VRAPDKQQPGAENGTVLLDVLTALVILAILLSLSVPRLTEARARFALYAAGRGLVDDLAWTRTQAILEGRTLTVVIVPAEASYRVEDAAGVVLRERRLAPGLALTSTAHRGRILFTARGTSNLYSTTWIEAANHAAVRRRGVRVAPTGSLGIR